jgi:hypothetical protein
MPVVARPSNALLTLARVRCLQPRETTRVRVSVRGTLPIQSHCERGRDELLFLFLEPLLLLVVSDDVAQSPGEAVDVLRPMGGLMQQAVCLCLIS